MTLDLRDVTADWQYRAGEICARMVIGRDGAELVQMRVDLGLMQMFPDGRPDGKRYRGLPTALEYLRHELRLGGTGIQPEDWRELERELYQLNYRRLAFSSLAEESLARNDASAARGHLRRGLRDIAMCLERVRLMEQHRAESLAMGGHALKPTLTFQQGRLRVQLHVVEQRYEEAIEEAQRAERALDSVLAEFGLDAEQREEDPGVLFLRDLSQRLRREYDIPLTLRERLELAVESDDFETAARLRDELRRREADPAAGDSDLDPR